MKQIIAFSLLFLVSCAKDKIVEVPVVQDCADTISFNVKVLPMITTHCMACHGDGAGTSPTFKDHATISANAEQMLKAMKGDGLPLMPDGGPALNDSLIQQFSCWISQGKLEN